MSTNNRGTRNIIKGEIGDIVYIQLPQMQLLVLSSLEDVEELLIRRSNVWSGRRDNLMVNELYVKSFN